MNNQTSQNFIDFSKLQINNIDLSAEYSPAVCVLDNLIHLFIMKEKKSNVISHYTYNGNTVMKKNDITLNTIPFDMPAVFVSTNAIILIYQNQDKNLSWIKYSSDDDIWGESCLIPGGAACSETPSIAYCKNNNIDIFYNDARSPDTSHEEVWMSNYNGDKWNTDGEKKGWWKLTYHTPTVVYNNDNNKISMIYNAADVADSSNICYAEYSPDSDEWSEKTVLQQLSTNNPESLKIFNNSTISSRLYLIYIDSRYPYSISLSEYDGNHWGQSVQYENSKKLENFSVIEYHGINYIFGKADDGTIWFFTGKFIIQPSQTKPFYGDSSTTIPDPAISTPIPADFTFNSPIGIRMDSNHKIWINDTGNNRIIVFDATLSNIYNVFNKVSSGGTTETFAFPFRIADNSEKDGSSPATAIKEIFVSDLTNDRVIISSFTGENKYTISYLADFGEPGGGPGQFNGVNGITVKKFEANQYTAIAVDEFGVENRMGKLSLFDVSMLPAQPVKFIRDILFVKGITEQGKSKKFFWPQGTTVDKNENIYISDVGFKRIIKCDQYGNGVNFSALSKCYLEYAGFITPRDVCIIYKDEAQTEAYIFVADNSAGAIFVFKEDGSYYGKFSIPTGPISMCLYNSPTGNEKWILVVEAGYPRVMVYNITAFLESPDNPFVSCNITAGKLRNQTTEMFSYVTCVCKNNNNFYALDAGNFRVRKFSTNYTIVQNFPIYIGVGSNITTLLTNGETRFIVSYPAALISPFGGCIFSYAESGNQFVTKNPYFFITNESYPFAIPRGLAVYNNEIYVADAYYNRIHFFKYSNEAFSYQSTYPDYQLNGPSGIDADENFIFIADTYNDCIKIINKANPQDVYFQFGSLGYDKKDFALPLGIKAVKKIGSFYYLFITDLVTRSIKVFLVNLPISSHPYVLRVVGYYKNFGIEKGGMWMPNIPYIEFNTNLSNGKILVPDGLYNRINIYDIALGF